MADNTQVNTGTGDLVRDIDRTGQPGSQAAKTQVMQIDIGGQYAESLVNPFNPVPTNDVPTAAAQSSDAPSFVAITGDPTGDFAGVNILEKLVDDSGDLSMAVKVVNPPRLDARGAMILSDAPAPINLVGAVGQFIYIDTAGYQSVHLTTAGLSASSIQASNDGITYAVVPCYQIAGTNITPTTAPGSGGSYVIPVVARYLRLTVNFAGAAVAYLRNIPAPNPAVIMPQNIAQIGGTVTTTVSGTAGGMLAVGGPAANALVPPAASQIGPVIVGGYDSGTPGFGQATTLGLPAVRRLLTDNTGRLRLAEEAATANYQNVPSLAVQDVGKFEDQDQYELLAMILLEMRINNQLMFSLPQQIYVAVQSLQLSSAAQSSFSGFTSDEPAAFRADPAIFNQ